MTDRQIGRETDRQTARCDRQTGVTDRQTDRQLGVTDRQLGVTDRQPGRETHMLLQPFRLKLAFCIPAQLPRSFFK